MWHNVFTIHAKIAAMNSRKLNGAITKRVIELHARGYDNDYLLQGVQIICVQDNQAFALENVSVKVVDQGYDKLTKSFKYIHSIDTGNGEKGVMVTEVIVANGMVA